MSWKEEQFLRGQFYDGYEAHAPSFNTMCISLINNFIQWDMHTALELLMSVLLAICYIITVVGFVSAYILRCSFDTSHRYVYCGTFSFRFDWFIIKQSRPATAMQQIQFSRIALMHI